MVRMLYILLFFLMSGCQLAGQLQGNQDSSNSPSISILPDNSGSSEVSSIDFSAGSTEDFFLSVKDSNNQAVTPSSISWAVVSGPASITPAADNLSIQISSSTSGSGVIRITVDGKTFDVNYSVAAVASCPGGPTVFSTNMNARNVIGQADFVSNSANRGGSAAANTLSSPYGVWVKDGKLYISDGANNRVLIYNSIPTTDGADADQVVGQPDFTTTTGTTSATGLKANQGLSVGSTYLAVSEWSNARVSLWPLSSVTTATMALGQTDLISGSSNQGGPVNKNTLAATVQVAESTNKMFVADSGNRRVLVYDKASLSSGMDASVVLGQADFTSSTSGSAPSGMSFPLGVNTDGTKLIVTDSSNNAVMLYNDISTLTTGMSADSTIISGYGTAANQLNGPVSSFYDGTKLFVADRGNDRILIFNSIPSPGDNADVIIGQNGAGSGDHNQCNCSTAAANTLWGAHFVYYDGCRLIVADTQNNRVLIY
ncbi:MAG: hypothetical protein KDD50_15145 [Bdellovibrionales bacterium]|nr:hypothetical protein [Bdellovibrionales bacterium]